jgi:hypothetical protein
MGRREIFHTFSPLVEIEGHFTHEFVTYVYETVGRYCSENRGKISEHFKAKSFPVTRQKCQVILPTYKKEILENF